MHRKKCLPYSIGDSVGSLRTHINHRFCRNSQIKSFPKIICAHLCHPRFLPFPSLPHPRFQIPDGFHSAPGGSGSRLAKPLAVTLSPFPRPRSHIPPAFQSAPRRSHFPFSIFHFSFLISHSPLSENHLRPSVPSAVSSFSIFHFPFSIASLPPTAPPPPPPPSPASQPAGSPRSKYPPCAIHHRSPSAPPLRSHPPPRVR